MKYSAYLRYFLFAIILFFSSCKDETVNPPVDDEIFKLDSLSLWINAGSTGEQYTGYSLEQTISANSLRLEYTLQSNADSVHAIGEHKDSTNGTPALPPGQFIYSPIDSQFSYTINVTTQPFYLSFYIRLIVSTPGSSAYYLRFRNIKLTRVN